MRDKKMEKKTYFLNYGTMILTLLLAGCGGSDSNSTTAASLGTVSKVGVTAIPNTNATTKPAFSGRFIEKGVKLLFNRGVANAAHTECQNNASPIIAAIAGGEIEIDEAIVILDQVEADLQGDSANDVKTGPFALDLLDNNPDAGETITMTLAAGNYEKLKTDFKRIGDNDPNSNIPAAITTKLLNSANERRPSVWIKGDLDVDGVCTPFTFVTDHRWKVTIPFVKSFADAGNGVDLIVLFRLVNALTDALTKNTANADALVLEVGAGTVDPMGAEFLDGRTKDPDHGTTLAEAWAAEIPLNMDVFAQDKDVVSIDDSTPTGTSLIDDSANRISGDDNPSADDLAETLG